MEMKDDSGRGWVSLTILYPFLFLFVFVFAFVSGGGRREWCLFSVKTNNRNQQKAIAPLTRPSLSLSLSLFPARQGAEVRLFLNRDLFVDIVVVIVRQNQAPQKQTSPPLFPIFRQLMRKIVIVVSWWWW